MKKISELFPAIPRTTTKSSGPRNERDEYLDYFHGRLKNAFRSHTGRELTKKRVAIAISHLKTIQDLHYLKHICEDGEGRGKPFSQIFWGSLRVKKDDPRYPQSR